MVSLMIKIAKMLLRVLAVNLFGLVSAVIGLILGAIVGGILAGIFEIVFGDEFVCMDVPRPAGRGRAGLANKEVGGFWQSSVLLWQSINEITQIKFRKALLICCQRGTSRGVLEL